MSTNISSEEERVEQNAAEFEQEMLRIRWQKKPISNINFFYKWQTSLETVEGENQLVYRLLITDLCNVYHCKGDQITLAVDKEVKSDRYFEIICFFLSTIKYSLDTNMKQDEDTGRTEKDEKDF